MRIDLSTILLVLSLLVATTASAIEPERSRGISMHMLPKRVADLGNQKWGFVVTFAGYLKPEVTQPVLQTSQEFMSFVQKQNNSVKDNGVWIVTTRPDAYSDPEKKLLEDIKELFRHGSIPLFIVRGSQLPNGWQRYDK